MRLCRSLLLSVPVVATIVVPFVPAEAGGHHDRGGAVIAGLIGLGLGAVAGSALGSRPSEYEPSYVQPSYAPVYEAPPPIYYAPSPPAYYAQPPRVVYVRPPPVAYPTTGYYVQQPTYAQPQNYYYRNAPDGVGFSEDDD
jgi:hypothetical protein